MSSRVRELGLLSAAGALVLLTLAIAGCSRGATPARSLNAQLGTSSAVTSGAPVGGTVNLEVASYAAEWRRVWQDHATWTRLVMIDIATNSPATAYDETRLRRTTADMMGLVKPYYDATQTAYFGTLMTTRTECAITMIGAVKAGNTAQVRATERTWYANASLTATFLAKANPNIDESTARSSLNRLVVLTNGEIVDHFAKRYSADIGDFDAVQAQSILFSDSLSNAIVRQFPSEF